MFEILFVYVFYFILSFCHELLSIYLYFLCHENKLCIKVFCKVILRFHSKIKYKFDAPLAAISTSFNKLLSPVLSILCWATLVYHLDLCNEVLVEINKIFNYFAKRFHAPVTTFPYFGRVISLFRNFLTFSIT